MFAEMAGNILCLQILKKEEDTGPKLPLRLVKTDRIKYRELRLTRAETHKQKLPQEAVPGEENLKCNCWRLSVDNLEFNQTNPVIQGAMIIM